MADAPAPASAPAPAPTADAPTPPSLLALPAPVLAATLDNLAPAELVRAVLLTSKHEALAQAGAADPGFWARAAGRLMAQFTPAGPAWFAVKGDHVRQTVMGARYPGAKRRAEEKVAAMLAAAGLTGAQWEWVSVKGYIKRLALDAASVPAGQTLESFLTLVQQQLTCARCPTRGSATSQCA